MMSCPGGYEGNGCMMPDFCISSFGETGKDGNECPVTCPQKCGPEEMSCWGGKDPNECTMPDFCIPMKGNPGHDGTECQVSCPVKCGAEEMSAMVDLTIMAVNMVTFAGPPKVNWII